MNSRNEIFDPTLKKSREVKMCDQMGNDIIKLSKELKQKEAELANLKSFAKNTGTEEQEEEIQTLKETLSEWEKLLDENQSTIKQKEDAIETLKRTLLEKEKKIKQMEIDPESAIDQNWTNEDILKKEGEIEKLKISENALKKEIAEYKIMLTGQAQLARTAFKQQSKSEKTLEKQVDKLEDQIEKLKTKIKNLEEKVPENKRKKADKQEDISNTDNSRNDLSTNNNNIPGYSVFSVRKPEEKKKTENKKKPNEKKKSEETKKSEKKKKPEEKKKSEASNIMDLISSDEDQ